MQKDQQLNNPDGTDEEFYQHLDSLVRALADADASYEAAPDGSRTAAESFLNDAERALDKARDERIAFLHAPLAGYQNALDDAVASGDTEAAADARVKIETVEARTRDVIKRCKNEYVPIEVERMDFLPHEYTYGGPDARLGIYAEINVKAKKGDETPLTTRNVFVINPVWLTGASEEGIKNTTLEISYVRRGQTRHCQMPYALLSDKRAMCQFLDDHGIAGFTSDPESLSRINNYFRASFNVLLGKRDLEASVSMLGWDQEKTSFTFGDVKITEDGPRRARLVSNTKVNLQAKGNSETWAAMMEHLNGYWKHSYALLVAAACVLYALTGRKAPVLSLSGETTGAGKTAAALAAASIFANYKDLMIDPESTLNAFYEKARVHSDVPIIADEMTKLCGNDKDRARLKQLILAFANGIPKSRANRDGSLKTQEPFTCTPIFTLNPRLHDMNMFIPAELARIVEINFDPEDALPKEIAREIYETIADNYGHAGRALVQYVIQHKAEVIGMLKEAEEWVYAQGVRDDQRYSAWQLSHAKVAGIIGRKLSLFRFDVETPILNALDVTKAAASEIKTSDDLVGDVITKFLNAHADHFTYADEGPKGCIFDATRLPHGGVVGRFMSLANGDTEVAISFSDLKDFALKQNVGSRQIMQYCDARKMERGKKVRLFPHGATTRCLVYIDAKHPHIKSVPQRVTASNEAVTEYSATL